MRIAMICHPHHPLREPWAGGMEMHSIMLTRALLERGHAVTLLAKEGSEMPPGAQLHVIETAEHDYALNPDPERGAVQDERSEAAIRRACVAVAADPPDVVINNSLSALPHDLLAEQPLVSIMHSPVPVPSYLERFARDATLPARHRFVTVSAANARAWSEHYPGVGVLPNGVDTAFWGAVAPTSAPHRDGGVPQALWTGRITHQKGVHVAIDAAQQAGVALRISGLLSDPDYMEEQVRPRIQAARAAGGPSIEHVGHLSHAQIRQELARTDVFIASPLWAEPFGLAPVEAMASGTPVAATPRGAMPEVIKGGGVVAESTETADLAAAIRAALEVTPAAARENAACYGLEPMAQRLEEIITSLP